MVFRANRSGASSSVITARLKWKGSGLENVAADDSAGAFLGAEHEVKLHLSHSIGQQDSIDPVSSNLPGWRVLGGFLAVQRQFILHGLEHFQQLHIGALAWPAL